MNTIFVKISAIFLGLASFIGFNAHVIAEPEPSVVIETPQEAPQYVTKTPIQVAGTATRIAPKTPHKVVIKTATTTPIMQPIDEVVQEIATATASTTGITKIATTTEEVIESAITEAPITIIIVAPEKPQPTAEEIERERQADIIRSHLKSVAGQIEAVGNLDAQKNAEYKALGSGRTAEQEQLWNDYLKESRVKMDALTAEYDGLQKALARLY